MTKTTSQSIALPMDKRLERDVLGTLLSSNRLLEQLEGLKPEYFSDSFHRKAFDIITKHVMAGDIADANTIRHYFAMHGDVLVFEGMIGMSVEQYIDDMPQHAVSPEKLQTYVKTIRDLYMRRMAIGACEDFMSAMQDAPHDEQPVTHMERMETQLFNLKTIGQTTRPTVPIRDAVGTAVAEAADAYQRGAGLMGLSTGFVSLDAMIGGLSPGNFFIVAGRPAMGKSALAVNIALNAAIDGHPVGLFSLEMSSAQLGGRVAAERTGLPSSKIRKGAISEGQWRDLNLYHKDMPEYPLYIDETGGITIAQLAMRARRMASQHGIQLIVIDYLQLLHGTKKTNGNRVNEITEITVALKALAKELNVPVIALSQLSRNVENRENKRPQLSDLRESGSIEQDADAVIFIYRPEYYLALQKPDETSTDFPNWQANMGEARGLAEVICAKNRHGPTGSVELAFNADTISFSERG